MHKQGGTRRIGLIAMATIAVLLSVCISHSSAESLGIGSARMQTDETPVQCVGVVIATFTGRFYIEAEDRSSGIRIDMASYAVSRDQVATVNGTMKTDADTGERYIAGQQATGAAGTAISPVGASNKAVGEL